MGDGVDGGHRRPPAQTRRPDAQTHPRPPDGHEALPPSSGDPGDVCPYQGLAPFDSERTELFFGRTRATRNLLERLAPRLEGQGTILLVSGPSGVGKSSLLRAGLIPALAKGELPVAGSRGWPRLLVTPTARPLRVLAEAWTRAYGGHVETVHERLRDDPRGVLSEGGSPAGRLLLVVDQFEELFTLVTDERERQAYVRALHAITEGPRGAAVIVGVRADYWDRCAAYPQFAEAIQDGQVIVEPMTESDLRLAITGPAAAVGLETEPGLVDTILGELRADRSAGDRYEVGALPLLSQALLNTWERREDGRLTVRGYEESGRVRDSVRRTADEVLARLAPEDRKTALRLLRRMTLITAGGRVVRRRVTLAEIHAAASAHSAQRRDRVQALLSAFADQRLLTLHEDTAEIAHDALLGAWPALRQWLEPDLAAQAVYHRLIEDAAQWAENHRDPAFLYRGARLVAVDDSRPRWDRDPDSFPPPGPIVDAFVAASTRAARRAGRRRRLVMAGLATLSVLALAAAGTAVNAANDADRQRRLAVSRQLAAQSEVADDPAVSSLLAVAAWRTAPTPEARYRMLDAAVRPGRGALRGHRRPVIAVEFSPDGSVLATGSDDGVVRLWDTATRRQLGAPITESTSGLSSCAAGFDVAFSPDGKILAVSCFRSVRFWDVSTRRQLGELDAATPGELIGSVQAMAFSPDGRILATSSYEGVTALWDLATRRRTGDTLGRPDLKSGDRAVRAVAFTPDGKRLVTAGADGAARLWDVATHRQIGTPFTGHTDAIHDISISRDGTTLTTASTDGTARMWSLATRKQIGALREPGDDRGFYGAAFSPDGKRLVTAGADGYTRLWDTADRRPIGPVLSDRRQSVKRVAFSPDGRTVAAADADGVVWLWDALVHRQIGTTMPALSEVRLSPDGRTLAAPGPRVDVEAGAADRAVRLWDAATQRQVGRPLTPADAGAGTNGVYEIRFGAGGRTLTTVSADRTARLWDTATQRQIGAPLRYPDRDTWFAEISPDGRLLATRHGESSIGFWDVASRREVGRRIDVPGRPYIQKMAFSPDGTTLAVVADDRSVRFFDVSARRQIAGPLPAATDTIASPDLAFSPDGRTLATTGAHGTVRLWDVAGRRQIGQALTGHTDFVNAIEFSPDGKTLATGSADDTVRLWDLQTQRQIGPPLTGHTGAVTEIDFSPDATTLATVGNDRTARLWNVAIPADPAARVCADVGRSFTRAEWRRYIPGEKFRPLCT